MRKKIIWIFMAAAAVAVAVIFVCDYMVTRNASDRLYDSVDKLPHMRVGLLLGTSPIRDNGSRNRYYDKRIQAGVELYKAGKVDRIIVSGGNYTSAGGYDEPVAMRDSLIAGGVPAEMIEMDAEGERTIKSIINARDKYHTDSVLLISQKFHNERAIYQADNEGVIAVGYNAATPPVNIYWVKNRSREYLARVKMFLEILLNTYVR